MTTSISRSTFELPRRAVLRKAGYLALTALAFGFVAATTISARAAEVSLLNVS